MREPTTAVIGAGISGLTAGKMLGDYGVPYTCFESSDRVGGNWAFGNPNGHSSAYRSLHIDTSKHRLSFKDFPMPDDYPDFPHHTQIKAYLDAYADAFGLREHIEFENGVVHARAPRRRRLGDHRPGRRRPAASTCSWSPTATTGTRGWPTSRASSPARPIHSHHYIDPTDAAGPEGQADPRRRPRQQRRRHRGGAVEQVAAERGDAVDPLQRLDRAEVHRTACPADKYFGTSPHIPLAWQRKARPEDASS